MPLDRTNGIPEPDKIHSAICDINRAAQDSIPTPDGNAACLVQMTSILYNLNERIKTLEAKNAD